MMVNIDFICLWSLHLKSVLRNFFLSLQSLKTSMRTGARVFVENIEHRELERANWAILPGKANQDRKAVTRQLEAPCGPGEQWPRRHRVPVLGHSCKTSLSACSHGTPGGLQSWPRGHVSPSGSENLGKFLMDKCRPGKYILLGRKALLNKHATFTASPGVNCVLVSLPTQPTP